jgi:hypothetical protein
MLLPDHYDQIDLKTNQVRRKLRKTLRAFVLSKPVLDGDIFSLNPSKLTQLLSKRSDTSPAPRKSSA